MAFYVVADDDYFLGAVGLINSLRVLGHDEPIFLLDCGLTAKQRALLEPHVTLVSGPRDTAPHLMKTIAPLIHPAETMLLVDADVVVTRPLTEPIENASRGRIVAFKNPIERSAAKWGRLLDLEPRWRHPYLCSGFVAMPRSGGTEVLELMKERSSRVDLDLSFFGERVDDEYPLLFADQDVLNAILANRVEPNRIVALDDRLAPMPPFKGLRVIDEEKLRCAYPDGREPFAVHHSLSPKPWQEPPYEGVYSRILRRVLTGEDAAVQVPREDLPRWLRTGVLAAAERQRIKASWQVRWRVRGFLRERLGSGRAT